MSHKTDLLCKARSITEEALGHMVMLGEPALFYVIHESLAHYHTERNHQCLTNRLITPEPDLGSQTGQVRRRERLDGLLSYYYRDAA
jgi:putative transposase